MHIKRVTVEEGFLHGLDLHLDRGLTVVIGARGSGKTSIIELIRFCLDAPSYSEGRDEVTRRQVLAVLGSGKVTVTIDSDGQDIVFSRSADEQEPRRSSASMVLVPIVLSQNEIEQVGRHPDSRLRLLDGFVPTLRDTERSEDAARALISSLTVELQSVVEEERTANDQLSKLATVKEDLIQARTAADAASAHLEQATDQRARLAAIGQLAAAAAVRIVVYQRVDHSVSEQMERINHLLPGIGIDPWPTAAESEDRLGDVREDVAAGNQSLRSSASHLELARHRLKKLQDDEQRQQIALEDEARSLRTFIDQLSEGAGVLMKRVSDLELLLQRSLALLEQLSGLRARANTISTRRNTELDRLDALRETRVNAREEAASFLNSKLGPRIRITVDRFGSVVRYAESLAEALRGSGLQYNILAPELARTVSPRELTAAVENNDSSTLVAASGITAERAQRVLQHLRQVGTEAILTAPLEDTVQLALLDGGAYKVAEHLSVGQRCTVVLPIILSHAERVLLVDQPEDNLDNSFIADTLVKVLKSRPATSQMIFATHNPNVPVLGEADRVVFLTSDGKSGEVNHVGALDDSQSVRAITDIMEGGRAAFDTRAAFYAQDSIADESS
jgi:ABC-type lipoprotein export system ATPase subunit